MKEDNIDKRIERVAESVGSKKTAMRQWEADRVSDELKRKVAAKLFFFYLMNCLSCKSFDCSTILLTEFIPF